MTDNYYLIDNYCHVENAQYKIISLLLRNIEYSKEKSHAGRQTKQQQQQCKEIKNVSMYNYLFKTQTRWKKNKDDFSHNRDYCMLCIRCEVWKKFLIMMIVPPACNKGKNPATGMVRHILHKGSMGWTENFCFPSGAFFRPLLDYVLWY